MSLQDEFVESTNPALQSRVQMAITKLAQDIGTEPEDTPNHQNRTNLGTQVVRSPQQFTQSFTAAICSQGVTSQSADADVTNACSAAWNSMAGPPPPATTVGPPAV